MELKTIILTPSRIRAIRLPNGKVLLSAVGYEDGVENIRIQATAAAIFPPIYAVFGEQTAAIAATTYHVHKVVSYPEDVNYVVFQTTEGSRRVPIQDAPSNDKASAQMADMHSSLNDNEVIGYAYNSNNYQKAFGDAVSQLQEKFPGHTSATVVESGFVGVGTPIGIAYTYVKMVNNS